MTDPHHTVDWGGDHRRLTDAVSVLVGADEGRYPSGNSLLIGGTGETLLIDPSITVAERGGAPVPIDAVVNSHGHEDHLAGNATFPAARVHIHEADRLALDSLDGLLEIYGLPDDIASSFATSIVEEFHYAPRPDAHGFGDGHVWDLGGGVTVEAVHLPGHTRGHSGFRVNDGVFFCSDIDLTGFGPYYGDAWSDLDDFEASLAQLRTEDAHTFVTFHHRGVIDDRARFLGLLDDFGAVIRRRHEAMLDHLREPRTLDDLVAHRFIYRPHVDLPFADSVERRSAELHLDRMRARGEISEVEPGRFRATARG